jgi:hypothetical protein
MLQEMQTCCHEFVSIYVCPKCATFLTTLLPSIVGTSTSTSVINVKGNQMCLVHSKRMGITKSDAFELLTKVRG